MFLSLQASNGARSFIALLLVCAKHRKETALSFCFDQQKTCMFSYCPLLQILLHQHFLFIPISFLSVQFSPIGVFKCLRTRHINQCSKCSSISSYFKSLQGFIFFIVSPTQAPSPLVFSHIIQMLLVNVTWIIQPEVKIRTSISLAYTIPLPQYCHILC